MGSGQPDPIECAKNRAHALLEGAEQALARGEIDEAGWYDRVASVITPAYLTADNPRARSRATAVTKLIGGPREVSLPTRSCAMARSSTWDVPTGT